MNAALNKIIMAAKQNSEFIVMKHSYTYAICKTCKGSGRRTRSFRKMNFVENCPTCKGEGRQRFTTTEEFPLLEALKELSIIK